MKAAFGLMLLAGCFSLGVEAQKECATQRYQENAISSQTTEAIEKFISRAYSESRVNAGLIRIPVVVHNLYHYPGEKVTDLQVQQQLKILNDCFRRLNSDTVNTPAVFRPFAADVEIEFVLARSDWRMAATTGINRKYTPVLAWGTDDKVKKSAEMGADPWDSRYYLNIWVCNLDRFAGYASFPGADPAMDGIVIDIEALRGSGNHNLNQGKTLVHEVGHWLGLKHLWGDELCGDDLVNDTPKQASYTPGCPNSIRITCGNGPYGDMYMNYMDFTSDACMNLFTNGQKARMRSLFTNGGPRATILNSKGLNPPLIQGSDIEVPDPKWLYGKLFPNPASSELNIDLSYDERWVGQNILVLNISGQEVLKSKVSSKVHRLDVSSLKPGIYFIRMQKPGESLLFKFTKILVMFIDFSLAPR